MKIEVLERPFDKSQIKQRPGRGGQMLDYVETPAVIRRLNEAFDYNWHFEVMEYQITDTEAVVLAKLTANGITKMQFGSSAISKGKDGTIYNTGDALKGAASDALKKCATLFGVGLHLYEDENGPQPENPKTEGETEVFNPKRAFEKCVEEFGPDAVEAELAKYGIKSMQDWPQSRTFWAELYRKLKSAQKAAKSNE